MASLESLISQKNNIVQNSDMIYRSEFNARLKANPSDHGKKKLARLKTASQIRNGRIKNS